MQNQDSWVSTSLVKEILFILGNVDPTEKQKELMFRLLSCISVHPRFRLAEILTERERTCLFWMMFGMPASKIAQLMQVKQTTIQAYRKQILLKLDCTSITQVISTMLCYQPIHHLLGKHFLE